MEQQKRECLSHIPSVEGLKEHPQLKPLLNEHPDAYVTGVIRQVLQSLRDRILVAGNEDELRSVDLDANRIIAQVQESFAKASVPNLHRVINATGIIVHTNLGRSLLADEAVKAMAEAATRYCNLELDLGTGDRGHRDVAVSGLLCELTGAEAATVVNNNAAAVLLALNTVAESKAVIVSRGQLIEIGGSFRLPDVMAKSGATLVEVGTTNRTYLSDYETAITEQTALLLHAHTSNYRVMGFTAEVSLEELVALGRSRDISVMQDLGSGAIVDLSGYGVEREPLVKDSVAAGPDIVTFSGDKLLGGPQAGVILGKKRHIDAIKKNPLYRAVRVDKLTLAAMETTLRVYRADPDAHVKIPTLRMITTPLEHLDRMAQKVVQETASRTKGRFEIGIEAGYSQVGGGTCPQENIPTVLVSINPGEMDVDSLARKLRQNHVPVVGRIHRDRLLLDMRTVLDDDLPEIIAALNNV